MLTVSNLSIHFAGRYLFDGITFTVRESDRIGLIGRNGSGKTTLLRIIAGKEFPDEGETSKPKDLNIGYLPQEGKLDSDLTVYEETALALGEIKEVKRLIREMTAAVAVGSDYESKEYRGALQKLSEANERYDMLGGGSVDAEIEQILTGLGFNREDIGRPVSEFSGGWQMRVELAKILLAKPGCVLLDEPSNHLDVESIQWLEVFLKSYPGAVIIVSHDSRFLDTATNRTIEIANGKIYDFMLPFSEFIEKRVELREKQIAAFKNQQKKIAMTERYIERFRYKASLASRVQSRVKKLEKTDRIELDVEDLSSVRFRFPTPPRSGKIVLEIEGLSKSYGAKPVLNKVDLIIERGEKIAFVGKNGEGKTTLSKIIAGTESCEGSMKTGYNVEIGYFAQHQAEMLDGGASVFEIIDNAAVGEMRTQVRNLLGAFLFSGEDIYKRVKTLSGGEKSRLAIARMLLQPSNFLILDEPTNHLDMVAKGVLKKALMDFQGTLIIVSHDRDFLEGLTDKTIEFKNNKLREYLGGINEFLEKHKIESLRRLEESKMKKSGPKPSPGAENGLGAKASAAKTSREKQKAFQRRESRIRRQIEKCEVEIEALEERKAALEELFAGPEFFSDVEKSKAAREDYDAIRKNIAEKTDEWAVLEGALEEM